MILVDRSQSKDNFTDHDYVSLSNLQLFLVLKLSHKICIGNSMICSDIWHKYHESYFEIVIRNFTSLYAREI